jgi:hypothetical protein
VIRNVVVGRLKPGVGAEEIRKGLDALAALDPPGIIDVKVGTDAGLREGNWDFAITSDFADVDSYRRYDLDDEHNRIRRELFAPISEEIIRIQFEV